jgi:hypothetical protein
MHAFYADPLNTQHLARSNFRVVRATSAKFGPHAGNRKLILYNEE